MLIVLLIFSLLLPPAAPARLVNIVFVSPPGESWTADEQARAMGAVLDATTWWARNSKVAVPAFKLGWTVIITPTDYSYNLFTWEQPYYHYPPQDLTVIIIDNSTSHKTMGGALGWSQVPCQTITALLGNSRDDLAFVLTHEYGHAVLALDHAPLGSFDIMAPSPSIETYHTNTIGYYTRAAMGETFHKTYLPLPS